MTEDNRQRLAAAGVGLEDALGRFMNNEGLLERFLKKFPEDGNYQKLTEAVAAGDWEAALTASHTLKGMCGNLSLTRLYQLFTDQVDLIRRERYPEAAGMMEDIAQSYAAVTEAIRGL